MLFIYPEDTIESVLSIKRDAMAALSNGGLEVTNWSSDSISVTKTKGVDLKFLIKECNDYIKLMDPNTFGPKVTRTRVNFT